MPDRATNALRAFPLQLIMSLVLAATLAIPASADETKPKPDESNPQQATEQAENQDAKSAEKPDAQPKAEAADKPAEKKPADKKPAEDKAKGEKAPPQKPEAKQPQQPAAKPKGEKAEKPTPDQAKAEKPATDQPKPTAPKSEKPEPKPRKSDLQLQGEFVGSVEEKPSKLRKLFLQIRGMGDGRFEALQYLDQPPTAIKHKPPTAQLIGKRHEDSLVLSGGPWAIMLQDDRALIVNRQGKVVGSLTRSNRTSPTLGAKPPKDALVLFDGSGTKQFVKGQMTEDGLLVEGTEVMPMFNDFNMHLEFRTPFVPHADGQARGNSGVYLQSRYEVQVLDSFALPPIIDGCGALYKFRPPTVNASLPPMSWQTYDIIFTSARWSADGSKRSNARITVWHNGIKVHDNVELPEPTGSGKDESPTLLPIRLQDHKNPVRYRNIWVIDRGLHNVGPFPVEGPAAAQK